MVGVEESAHAGRVALVTGAAAARLLARQGAPAERLNGHIIRLEQLEALREGS
jgi:hypothetical protein